MDEHLSFEILKIGVGIYNNAVSGCIIKHDLLTLEETVKCPQRKWTG